MIKSKRTLQSPRSLTVSINALLKCTTFQLLKNTPINFARQIQAKSKDGEHYLTKSEPLLEICELYENYTFRVAYNVTIFIFLNLKKNKKNQSTTTNKISVQCCLLGVHEQHVRQET